MSNVFVSLVSDQTIPNVLFIKEIERMREDIRLYLFISTDTMEKKGKTNSVIQGSHINNSKIKTEVIKVIEDSIEEINYLTGGWFEEYGYNLIREHIQLNNDRIGLNVQISHAGTQNEFDVMFVHENVLYVIECKTALKDDGRNLLNDTLYKLSALKKDFGLIVRGYLFTLDKNLRDADGRIKNDYQNRAALLGVRLVDGAVFSDEKKLNGILDSIKGGMKDV